MTFLFKERNSHNTYRPSLFVCGVCLREYCASLVVVVVVCVVAVGVAVLQSVRL